MFSEHGCLLLADKYVNNVTKMPFRCSCGNVDAKSLTTFKKNPMCSTCATKRAVDRQRFTFEYVKRVYVERGCIPLFTEYHNAREPLPYICSCGEYASTSFYSFKRASGCRNCAAQKLREDRRFDINEVRKYIESRGCKLLSTEYINARTPLLLQCSRGHEFAITLDCYSHSKNDCPQCYLESNRGPNHPSWDHTKTAEERYLGRRIPGYWEWRFAVYQRDNFTCQACGATDRRLLRIDLDNGITLCTQCHKEFHKQYGNRNNSRQQMAAFLADKFREQKRRLEMKEKEVS